MNRAQDSAKYAKEIDAKLIQIASSIKKARSDTELSRLDSALDVIHQRLSKGDYQRFSYTENVFDVPNKTSDFFTDLEFYCQLGNNWAAIFQALELDETTKIADLCPGYTPKIELGLFYEDFKGQVDVIDSDIKSINQLTDFMALFKPNFSIQKKTANVLADKLDSYDIVCGNHIIDDLLLFIYCQKQDLSLGDLYAKEPAMRTAWQAILQDKDVYAEELTTQLVNALKTLVKPGGHLCLSQYASYMERMLNLPEASKFNKQILDDVVSALLKAGFINIEKLLAKALANTNSHFGINDCYLLQRS